MSSLMVVAGLLLGQSRLEGHVYARGTRDAVPLASIAIDDEAPAAETDAEGAFAIPVAAGKHRVTVRAAGHAAGTFEETVGENEAVQVEYRLVRNVLRPYETLVRGKADRAEQARIQLSGAELTEVPGTAGEPLRVVTVLPGVTSPMSGISYPIVRGAVPAATGFFLDGVAIPALYHLMVGPSVIHPDFIEQVDFYASNAPVRFGRVTAGVVSATVAKPHDDRIHLTASGDALNASAFLEAPIPQTGTHVTIAGRASYTGGVLSLVGLLVPTDIRPVTEFYDYQARIEQKLGNANLRLLAFGSSDLAGYRQRQVIPEKKGAFREVRSTAYMSQLFHKADLRGLLPVGPGTFELGATVGAEQAGITGDRDDQQVIRFLFGRSSIAGRAQYRVERGAWQLKLGLEAERQSSAVFMQGDEDRTAFQRPSVGIFVGGFAEGAYLGERMDWIGGVRVDNSVYAGHVQKLAADPRLEAHVRPTDWLELHASAGLYHQPPMLLVTLPVTEVSELANGLQEVIQTQAGVRWSLPWSGLTLSVDGFYNHLTQARERSLSQFLTGVPSIDDTLAGRRRGRSYGLEVMLRAPQQGRFFGWLTYSLMRSERLHRFVVFDETFDRATQAEGMLPFTFDQTHVLNVVAGVQLPRGWKVGATVHFNTGRPESGEFSSRTMVHSADDESWVPVPLDRVDRLPAFFRLDARVSKTFLAERFSVEAYLDVLNITGREEVVAWQYNSTGSSFGGAVLSKQPTGIPLFYPALGVKGTY